MILAGDELGNSQGGNNNAYCQDNETSWIDWGARGEADLALADFVRHLIQVRRDYPILRRARFLTGDLKEELELRELTWLTPDATEMTEDQWHDPNARTLAVLLDGRAQTTGIKRRANDVTLLLVLNAHHEVVEVTFPEVPGGMEWDCLVDTDNPDLEESEVFRTGDRYPAAGRALLLFELRVKRRRAG
jgi:glycogen operon protein